jgi:tetratricopeptide (TPR) repeat protein
MAALLFLGATAPASEEGIPAIACTAILSKEDQATTEAYRGVVRLYRAGHEKEALAELPLWPSKDIGRAAAALVFLGEHPECLEPNSVEARDVEAAALLETDRALADSTPSDASERDLDLKRADRLMVAATRGAGPDRRCRWLQAIALYYHAADALDAAEEWYERSLAICPGDADTLFGLGLVHERRATRHLHGSASSRDPRTGTVGYLQATASELVTAERFYRRALEIAPGRMELQLRLARIRQTQGKAGEAVAELQDILAQPSAEPVAVYLAQLMSGAIHERAGRLQEAARCYRAALLAEPRAQVATIALSHALYRAGQRVEAGQVLERWLENVEGPPPADVDDWMVFEWGSPARVFQPQERVLGQLRQELAR